MSVTICIPSYNRADLVEETLDSIVEQTRTDWEAIVVDDGSTDGSVELIAAYARRDPRIKLRQRDREPRGACSCRNIAVEHAAGRYVMFLDTDDLLAPFCLEQRVRVVDHEPLTDFAVFPMYVFKGKPGGERRLWNIETEDDVLVRLLRMDPICQGTGTLWRRDSFIQLGLWDEELLIWQDIELHLRAFAGQFAFTTHFDLAPDVFLRESEESLSRGQYYSRPKLNSRSIVAKRAVDILRAAGRDDLIAEVRYLCSSVALGAAASGNLDLAREMRIWGKSEGILTAMEALRLRLTELSRASRLDRLPVFRSIRDRAARVFAIDNTVGRIEA
ncbi:MAG: glycosyltransferase family A protein [Gemmatimonadaceae bacterium]